MSNYHGDIMNIPVDDDLMNYIAKTDAEVFAYKVGHKDARHEAAELGDHADCVIEELRIALKMARATLRCVQDGIHEPDQIENRIAEIESALKLGGN